MTAEVINGLVRPFVTLLLAGTLCYGFIVGKIPQEQFLPVVVMAIGFWFGSRGHEMPERQIRRDDVRRSDSEPAKRKP